MLYENTRSGDCTKGLQVSRPSKPKGVVKRDEVRGMVFGDRLGAKGEGAKERKKEKEGFCQSTGYGVRASRWRELG